MPRSLKNMAKYVEGLDRILELVVVLNDDMTRSLEREGLTASRAPVVWALQQQGPITQKALAEALQVSARNITGLVDGLVATGFVTREPHPTDRRATLVCVTERGKRVTEAWARDQKDFARILFEGMPEKKFDCFVNGLDVILTRLREHGVSLQREAG